MARRAASLAPGLGAWLLAVNLMGADCRPYEVSVIVDGLPAPEYAARGRIYVEALRDRSFSLRLSNPTAERVAVALSVDGLNVVDAKRTTSFAATKWVLMPGQTLEVPGWQISGETARRFFFTETRSSYAKWLGDTRNVGTIEAVFFREKRHFPPIVSYGLPERNRGDLPRPSEGRGEDEARTEASAGAPRRAAPSPAPGDAMEEPAVSGASPDPGHKDSRRKAHARDSDSYAATGAGERTSFPVEWIAFEEDPKPVARIALRYEFRPELLRLGVLFPREDLYARERGRGFKGEYAPDPRPNR